MSYRNLMQWLDEFDPHGVPAKTLVPLVESAIADVANRPQDETIEKVACRLDVVLEKLLAGDSVGDELDDLADEFSELPENALDELEREYCEFAQDLGDGEWQTEIFQSFSHGVKAIQVGQVEQGMSVLNPLYENVKEAWRIYTKTLVHEDEVTIETVVGHRLLKLGTQLWMQAFERAGQGHFEEALVKAEQATRHLVAVQIYAEDIEEESSTRI